MKKLFIVFISLVVMSSCTTTKEAKSSRAEARKEKKAVERALVKNAVESRRYIIKLDRIYSSYGRISQLVPRANYIIIDRDRAIINALYMGRQFDVRPIAAINVRGMSENYAVTDNVSKGLYNIKMKVNNGGSASFELYLTISKDGTCNASVSSLKIDNMRYSGYLVPISENSNASPQQEQKGDTL